MFNPLTPAEYAAAIGRAARDAARDDQPPWSEFRRGQLMSAYSGSRHLAVELECFTAELQAFAVAAAQAIARAAAALPDRPVLRETETQLRESSDPASIGGRTSELLCQVRGDDSETITELRFELRGLLRDLCDREVQLLAEAIESGAPR